jgi:hypothetical protein
MNDALAWMYFILRPSAFASRLECEHLWYGSCACFPDKAHILAVYEADV